MSVQRDYRITLQTMPHNSNRSYLSRMMTEMFCTSPQTVVKPTDHMKCVHGNKTPKS